MDRRSFLTGLTGTTLVAALPGNVLAVPQVPVPLTARPAIGLLDVWWDIADKRGLEVPEDQWDILPPGSVCLTDWERRWKLEKIVHDRRDSVVNLLEPLGFDLPRVHFHGDGCLHGNYHQDWNRQREEDAVYHALHARFDRARCGVSWLGDDRHMPEEYRIKGDVHLVMAVRHPQLTLTGDEILDLLTRHSTGIVDARFDIVQEITQTAVVRRS